jgi:hypothetical protein
MMLPLTGRRSSICRALPRAAEALSFFRSKPNDGLARPYRDQRQCACDVGCGVLLLFLRGRSFETVQLSGGTIPPHNGHGPVRIAF